MLVYLLAEKCANGPLGTLETGSPHDDKVARQCRQNQNLVADKKKLKTWFPKTIFPFRFSIKKCLEFLRLVLSNITNVLLFKKINRKNLPPMILAMKFFYTSSYSLTRSATCKTIFKENSMLRENISMYLKRDLMLNLQVIHFCLTKSLLERARNWANYFITL